MIHVPVNSGCTVFRGFAFAFHITKNHYTQKVAITGPGKETAQPFKEVDPREMKMRP
jgi:hypothetical protein